MLFIVIFIHIIIYLILSFFFNVSGNKTLFSKNEVKQKMLLSFEELCRRVVLHYWNSDRSKEFIGEKWLIISLHVVRFWWGREEVSGNFAPKSNLAFLSLYPFCLSLNLNFKLVNLNYFYWETPLKKIVLLLICEITVLFLRTNKEGMCGFTFK